jgi:hypothetical protein
MSTVSSIKVDIYMDNKCTGDSIGYKTFTSDQCTAGTNSTRTTEATDSMSVVCNAANTQATFSIYSDKACKTATVTPPPTQTLPNGNCSLFQTVGGDFWAIATCVTGTGIMIQVGMATIIATIVMIATNL